MKTIKYLRMTAGQSQRELAARMGTTQPALSAWENGRGTMPEARRGLALESLRRGLGKAILGVGLQDLDLPWDEVSARLRK